MKTGLQELIERLLSKKDEHEFNTDYDDGVRRGLALAIVTATELLEKEKEQIEGAYYSALIKMGTATDEERYAKTYYTETYGNE